MARILILEETPSWNNVLLHSLRLHHSLELVSSSEDALSSLERRTFDLIVTRVHLKSSNLFLFLDTLQSNPAIAHIPVVCFCGIRSRAANIGNNALRAATCALGAKAYFSVEQFCFHDTCDLNRLRLSIESCLSSSTATHYSH